ncbi:MAG TPA: hypothetical protein VJ910_10190 [Desulfuromonadales bacterium]|nr:hypothetical protein [Desulfuromonadales bacterium]
MLYLDIMTQDGGQMYLDIRSVEMTHRSGAAGISMQGVLGDGYQEAQALVEYRDGEVTLTCIDCSAADFAVAGPDCGDDLSERLQRALKEEICHAGDAGVWPVRGNENRPLLPARR